MKAHQSAFFSFMFSALLACVHAGCDSPPPSAGGGADGGVDGGSDAGNGGSDAGGSGSDAGVNSDVPFTNGVSTLAGWSDAAYVDGSRAVARFSNPVNVAYRAGSVYVADFDNGKLRVIDAATHVTSTVFGPANFQRPFGLAFAADGALYVSTDNDQTGAHSTTTGTIWKVDVAAKTATVVANAIGRPRGIVALADGRLAAADYVHHVIEIIDAQTGAVTVIAGAWDTPGMADGGGTTARFSAPYGIVQRADGNLVVADHGNNLIRLVGLDGTTTTLAGAIASGFADGTLSAARFNHPQGVSISADDAIYVTDADNFRVRKIAGGQVTTVVGDGTDGYLDADDPLAAEMHGLEGLSVVPDGSMAYIADGNRGDTVPYDRVRQAKLQ